MIGFDKSRKQFVFRQFHVESFVIQYVTTDISADRKTIVFTSESIENIPAHWHARETYKIVSPDEFVEVFELAGPCKDFEVYRKPVCAERNNGLSRQTGGLRWAKLKWLILFANGVNRQATGKGTRRPFEQCLPL